MAATTRVRVKPGQVIRHAGKDYKGGDGTTPGEEFDMPSHILPEFRWQVEEVGADGTVREVRGIHVAGAEAPHERKAYLEQQLDAAKQQVVALQNAIEAEDEAIAKQQSESESAGELAMSDADKVQSDMNLEAAKNMQDKADKAGPGFEAKGAGHPNAPAGAPTEKVGKATARGIATTGADVEVEHVDEAAKGGKVVNERK